MDEKENPVVEMSEPVTPPATTAKARFKGFARYHFTYSFLFLVFFALVLVVATLPSLPVELLAVPCVISMLLYFPLGMLAAKRRSWTVPTLRGACLAILQPCGISVLWVLLFPLIDGAFQIYAFLSVLFAAPSSSFFIFLLVSKPSDLLSTMYLFGAALLAAVLPPLLFALGSFFQAKRQIFSRSG